VWYLAGLGIDILHFEPFAPFGRGSGFPESEVNPDDYVRGFAEALDVAAECGVSVTEFGLFHLQMPRNQQCFAHYASRFVVNPDGRLTFCLGAQDDNTQPGNMLGVGTPDIDMGTVHFEVDKVRRLQTGFNVEKIEWCNSCSAKHLCCGICPAHNILRTGDAGSPDSRLCSIRKGILREALLQMWKHSAAVEDPMRET